MASTSIALTPLLRPPLPKISFPRTTLRNPKKITPRTLTVKAQAFDFPSTFFEEGFGRRRGRGEDDDEEEEDGPDPTDTIGSILMGINDEEKEEPQCPPGLRKYETMAVLRPDMSEDARLVLTQKYEEV